MPPCHGGGHGFKSHSGRHFAFVAQLVEQRTENPRVSGSIPLEGTIFVDIRPRGCFYWKRLSRQFVWAVSKVFCFAWKERRFMEAFWAALAVVVLAELGDKTQLLAIAFTAKYNWKTVMAAVFAATVANHFFAVIAGVWLGSFLDAGIMKLLASVAFIVFGLWTLRGDELDGEEEKSSRSPFWTVAIAFFLAEMGDKTQFATITLAAQYQQVFPVLAGTTTGMIVADGFGIIVGVVLQKAIPEKALKYFAAAVFLVVGVAGLAEQFLM